MDSFREMADACCDHCRTLEGTGPWCPRCGIEMPGSPSDEDEESWFSNDLCIACWDAE